MATKKLTPVKATTVDAPGAPELTVAELRDAIKTITDRMDNMTNYLHSVDWKLWMLMNMVRLIGEENGYSFNVLDKANNGSEKSKDYGDEV